MTRWLAAIALLLATASAIYWFRGEIAMRLARGGASSAISSSLATELPDGLHAVFCGTGSPLPDRRRAGPCLAIIAGERVFVFDAGEGATETLSLMGVSPGEVDGVFLTHLHSDHFDGLAALALQHWANAAAEVSLGVTGPAGTARVIAGLNDAYTIDAAYRTAHHGPDIMPPSGAGLHATEFQIPEIDGEQVVLRDEHNVRITAFRVDHAPTAAVGYRIEYGGRSIIVSGDTARSQSLTVAAAGADLLVHEAISPRLNQIIRRAAIRSGRENIGAIFDDILDYHTSSEDVGAIAQEAGVHQLALTHFLPQPSLPGLDASFVRDAKRNYAGPVWAMRDGDVISLPRAGGVRRSHHLRFGG